MTSCVCEPFPLHIPGGTVFLNLSINPSLKNAGVAQVWLGTLPPMKQAWISRFSLNKYTHLTNNIIIIKAVKLLDHNEYMGFPILASYSIV